MSCSEAKITPASSTTFMYCTSFGYALTKLPHSPKGLQITPKRIKNRLEKVRESSINGKKGNLISVFVTVLVFKKKNNWEKPGKTL